MEINLDQLQKIFDDMKRTGFDVETPLKWNFYFVNNSEEALRNVLKELNGYHYKLEKLEKIDRGELLLQVSKIDVLSLDKLYRRNIAFNELAQYCQIKGYDGWDVERLIDNNRS